MPDAFYASEQELTLRFGDVVSGFPALQAQIEVGGTAPRQTYAISVAHPAYAIVMNPCCSIRDGILALCPMKNLDKSYLKSDKIKEDPLRMNERMLAKDVIPRQRWDKLTDIQKAEKEREGLKWVFTSVFALAPHALLPDVEVEISGRRERIGHYEIDFRDICSLRSKDIEAPEKPVKVVTKILQLSDPSRELLRNKLQNYFQRVGVEA